MFDFLITHSPLLYLTQSLWRDEVFSIFVAKRPIISFIGSLSFEPPLYYIILHVWMKLFGDSEIATRTLSFVAFIFATIIIIFWAEKRFKKHWLSWYLPVFFFLNPMLLYYAFEVRTYGWYIFFATVSFVTYIEKKWKWFIVATTLGFYTHAYAIIVPCVALLHYVVTNWKLLKLNKLNNLFRDQMVRSFAIFFLLISPWLIIIIKASAKLKESWYFPVDLHLIRSVIGNMFVGYEGTPWYGWTWTATLSTILVLFFIYALLDRTKRKVNLFFFLMIVVPLILVVSISFIKPLFVNRYLIPVTVAQVFLVIFAIETIANRLLQKVIAAFCLLFVIGVNIWYPNKHPKTPSRDTLTQVNALWDSDDVVYATSPLVLFEAQYYSSDPARVFLYNPSGSPFPWFVGDFIVDPQKIINYLPKYPSRAFFIHEDGSYGMGYRFVTNDITNDNSNK